MHFFCIKIFNIFDKIFENLFELFGDGSIDFSIKLP